MNSLPPLTPEQMESLKRRFWQYVTKSDGCWIWTGYKIKRGYGSLSLGPKSLGMMLAHRLSYLFEYGTLPDLFLCHHCDNPSCVRPDHLFPGTQKDNMADCAKKGRTVVPAITGEDHYATSLTQSQVDQIRAEYRPRYGAMADLSRKYGVSEGVVQRILQGLTWKKGRE